MRLQPGQTVGRYDVLDAIGHGGMSESYRARDTKTGQTVVIKLPDANVIGDPGAYGRYQRETEIGRRLDHPHIQRLLDTGQLEGVAAPYIVMEYVDGEPFRAYLAEHAPLAVDDAVDFGRQIADALQACHAQGIVHRDLKPENVLITPDRQLKLLDFGIALLQGARRLTWSRLTNSVGTPDYMAPEQVRGERGDVRTDVYALGAMLFEMLTGKVPYDGDNPLSVMSQHVNAEAPRVRSRRSDVPAALDGITARALRRDPAQRYQTMAEFKSDLDRWPSLDSSPIRVARHALAGRYAESSEGRRTHHRSPCGSSFDRSACPTCTSLVVSKVEKDVVTQALQRVRDAQADFIHLQFTDILGAVKGVTIPASRLETALTEGVWFDGSSVEGWARVAESDLYLRPDPSSLTIFPWESPPAARFMCDLTLPDGEPFAGDPRQALRRVLGEAADMGFDYRVSAEVEFFLLTDTRATPLELARDSFEPSDGDSYYSLPTERTTRVCQLVARTLEACGFSVAATHHEVSPGQHEIDLAEHDALRLADAIATLKIALRACGQREQLLATFMPKPVASLSGSGLHFQQALHDRTSGENAFFDQSATYGLSRVGRYFVAGQLAHARGLCALMAPLVNSYKRLSGGGEAPALIDWARINRGALIRVPELGPGGERIFVELRSPDPSCNPYLALAGALKAGLEGIAGQLDLADPVEERQDEQSTEGATADPLPSTLGEAIEELEWDPVARAALGQVIYERYLAAKEQEWAQYRDHISLWELQTYLSRA